MKSEVRSLPAVNLKNQKFTAGRLLTSDFCLLTSVLVHAIHCEGSCVSIDFGPA